MSAALILPLKGQKKYQKTMSRIGIIGGSGLYHLTEFNKMEEFQLETPFGRPSAPYRLFEYREKEVVFLPRHGTGHQIPPSAINYRANIYGMKKLGVSKILSVSACGSLKKQIKPLDFAVSSQFIDRTTKRMNTFFEDGLTVHVSLAKPTCQNLEATLLAAVKPLGLRCHQNCTYLNMEGPQFSTRAESFLYKSWNADIIGMTNFTEARLAREAEICYASLSAVTDYDCWHSKHEEVEVDLVLECMKKNNSNAKEIIKKFVLLQEKNDSCICREALKHAIVTQADNVQPQVKEKVKLLIQKYIK